MISAEHMKKCQINPTMSPKPYQTHPQTMRTNTRWPNAINLNHRSRFLFVGIPLEWHGAALLYALSHPALQQT